MMVPPRLPDFKARPKYTSEFENQLKNNRKVLAVMLREEHKLNTETVEASLSSKLIGRSFQSSGRLLPFSLAAFLTMPSASASLPTDNNHLGLSGRTQ